MRNLSLGLTSYLEGSLIALTNCIKVTRLDGEQFGFCSLDTDITFDGVTYEAETSVDMSELRSEVGQGVDNAELLGLITSDRITDTDLLAGIWDGAAIELFHLPFEDTSLGKIILLTGTLGEISHQRGSYRAEIRSLSQRLSQQFVELTSPLCRVRHLFDARCMPKGYNEGTDTGTLFPSDFRFTRAVAAVVSSRVLRFADDTLADDLYRYGLVTFTTGLNAGLRREIKAHAITPVTPINPTTLSDLQLNLIGTNAIGANGAGCATWTDTSGNSRDATQATAGRRPLVQDGASPAGVRMLNFDGVDDLMVGSFPGSGGIDISEGMTLYVYGEEQALTTAGLNRQALFTCGNNQSQFELLTRTTAAAGVGWPDQEYGVNSGNAYTAHGATQLGFQTLTLVFEPPPGVTASFRLYRDGVQLGAAGVHWAATAVRDFYTVGNIASALTGFDGLIGAVSVFSVAHAMSQRRGVEAYLANTFAGSGFSDALIELQEPFPYAVAVGDVAVLEVGCDRTFGRCQTVFKNAWNFQGEIHLPGNQDLLKIGRG